MLTILPFFTVTRTWASPYWVGIASPVAVPEVELELDFEDEVAVATAVDADAVRTAGEWGWKARTPAVPAIVAPMTMGARRMALRR
jgi:hypothetical protein